MIAASDDSVVQKRAITSLSKVSNQLSDEAIQNNYFQLCRRFKKGEIYAMRIAACHLLADIYSKLSADKREQARKKYAKLARDDTPMVRWGLA